MLTQSSANAKGHVCAAFRQENAFLLCNVPTEEREIGRRGSWIYLSLHFSAMGVPEILTFSAFYQQKARAFGHQNQAKAFICQCFYG